MTSDGSGRVTARAFRFAVNVTPKPGILDPQGRAVEGSLAHLGLTGISDVRVGRRVELSVEARDAESARSVVERLASELLANALIEAYQIEAIGAISGARTGVGGTDAGGTDAGRTDAAPTDVPGVAPGMPS